MPHWPPQHILLDSQPITGRPSVLAIFRKVVLLGHRLHLRAHHVHLPLARMITPSLFSLIDKEIGVARAGPRGRLAGNARPPGRRASSGWCATTNTASPSVPSKPAPTTAPTRSEPPPIPDLANPFRWFWSNRNHEFLRPRPGRFAPSPKSIPKTNFKYLYKPEENADSLAAKRSYLGRVYLDWAQYPITQTGNTRPTPASYIVDFQDLRFTQLPSLLSRGGSRKALGAGVQLDRNLRVLGDVYGPASSA